MKKIIDFNQTGEDKSVNDEYMNEKIESTLNAQFEIPKTVNAAKEEAFAKIREKAAQKTAERKIVEMGKSDKRKKKKGKIFRTAMGITAAAAAFSAVCIVNPAFASNIPLIGKVFAQVGSSLGFAGDYKEYAKPLEKENAAETPAKNEEELKETDSEEKKEVTYSKTVDGTTVTLSEVYCNDVALYLSMIIETEEKFPQTGTWQDGTPLIDINNSSLDFSYNPSYSTAWGSHINGVLDGKMLDEHRFAGVLRVDLAETTYDYEGSEKLYADRNAILLEQGIDLMEEGGYEKLAAENPTDQMIEEYCGLNSEDYMKEITVPDKFDVSLNIRKIIGKLPEDQISVPEMPQEFRDEYEAAMAEHGLDEANYENFTEEEKEIEHQLFTEMHRKYDEKYPDAMIDGSSYTSWTKEGGWDFNFQVEKNTDKNIVKEINLLDENGEGIISLTKTPFEIYLECKDSECKYFPVVLDADGNLLDVGKSGGRAEMLAIANKDVSTVYVYLCDYIEYMDELKGYYWSLDYEEKAKTKTFKQLLDENAILKTEVTFDE